MRFEIGTVYKVAEYTHLRWLFLGESNGEELILILNNPEYTMDIRQHPKTNTWIKE